MRVEVGDGVAVGLEKRMEVRVKMQLQVRVEDGAGGRGAAEGEGKRANGLRGEDAGRDGVLDECILGCEGR